MLEIFAGSMQYFLIHGIAGLFLLSFLETSFLPVPADVLLIIMGLMNRNMAMCYALVAIIGSSLGGILTYIIGFRARSQLLVKWVPKKRIEKIEQLIEKYGGWALLVVGFTPVSYTAGLFKLNWIIFLVTFITGRAIKFVIEAVLIIVLGEKAAELLKYHHAELTALISAIIAGMVIITYLTYKLFRNYHKRKRNII
ncbi:MAG: YqaA family protein [Syntrophomonadaceae bacterium]|jgi:membrane protein YqaA with SNARE-associated domain